MTVSQNADPRDVLNRIDLNQLAEALALIKFGNMISRIKIVVTALAAASAVDITAAATKAASVITGITLDTGENLPPVGSLVSLRVTASGTGASLGTYTLSDTGGTALLPPGGASLGVGIAKISDDAKTLTFPNTVTAFTLIYFAAPAGGADQNFVIGAP